MSLNSPTASSGRFFGAMKAIYVLTKYPLSGRGVLSRTKAATNSAEGAGYGFMGFAARIGILGMVLYLFFFYRSIKQYCYYYSFNPSFAKYALISFLAVLFAQAYSDSLLYFMVLLSSIIYPNFGLKRREYNNESKYIIDD